MRRLGPLWLALGALGLACAGASTPPPPSAGSVVVSSAAPAGEAAPMSSASASPAPHPSAAPAPAAEPPSPAALLLEVEAATPIPDAPAKSSASGSAAIVWVPDDQAERHIKSVLIEPAAGDARVLAERKEPVFIGSGELWVLRTKKLRSRACNECDACLSQPPTCRKERVIDIEEPFLKGLRTGKVFEPWSTFFVARRGCKETVDVHDTTLSLEGGVGIFYFFSVNSWDQSCGAAHPFFSDEMLTLDMFNGKASTLSFPKQPLEALRLRAHAELVGGCALDPKEQASAYRATAAYAPNGELHGIFGFTMSAPYVCGSGPGHYTALSEQESDWIPPELATWGKLPDWVTAYAQSVSSRYAFMLEASRLAAAKREFRR